MPDVLILVDAMIQAQAMEKLPRPTLSLSEVFEALWTTRYTGDVTLHFFEGAPRGMKLPNPIQIVLD